MEIKIEDVRALAEILTEHRLSVLEIEEDGLRIKLGAAAQNSDRATVTAENVRQEIPAKTEKQPEPAGDIVRSPMVGVFYEAPSPDAEPYQTVGNSVKRGDVLCIIEAMKLMNEITAEQDGRILEIHARNGQVVEFDQPLFTIG